MEEVDKEIKNLVINYLADQSDFLKCCFEHAQYVSDFRVKESEAYGFEWAPHTAFAYYLIRNNILGLKIGQMSETKKKYDLRFKFKNHDIVIELKTVPIPGVISNSYVKTDLEKQFPKQGIPYLLVFSYPSDDDNIPDLDKAQIIASDITHEKFRFYLYRIFY